LAAPVGFTGSYSQNFDSMGTAGTTAPAGWAEYSLSGSHDQFSFAGSTAAITTTVLPSDFSNSIVNGHDGLVLTNNAALTAATPTNQRAANGFNFGLAASPNDRALGTSPTGVSACQLELGLTNNTGASVNTLNIAYDIRRFSTTAVNNSGYVGANIGLEELPGYWLFYSLDNGTSWANVSDLNPTKTGPGGVIVPNSVGVTNVPSTSFTLGSAWANGSTLLLRWFDDNAQSPSPDQLVGLDNVAISVPEPMAGLLMAGIAPIFLCGRRSKKE
jgi:hypothetical protein